MNLFCTLPHAWICTSKPNPRSRPMPSTILRESSSNSRGGGKTAKERKKKKQKNPHFSASNSQLTSRGLFPKLDIDCPNLKDSFAPVLIWHFFSAYLKGFRPAVFLSDENAVFPPAVLQSFVVRLFQYQY